MGGIGVALIPLSNVKGAPVILPFCGSHHGHGGVPWSLHWWRLHAALLQTAAGQIDHSGRHGICWPRPLQQPCLDPVRLFPHIKYFKYYFNQSQGFRKHGWLTSGSERIWCCGIKGNLTNSSLYCPLRAVSVTAHHFVFPREISVWLKKKQNRDYMYVNILML